MCTYCLIFFTGAVGQRDCILLNQSKNCTVFTSLRVIYAFHKRDSNPELELIEKTSVKHYFIYYKSTYSIRFILEKQRNISYRRILHVRNVLPIRAL